MYEIFTKGITPYAHLNTNILVSEAVINSQRLECPPDCPPIIHELMLRTWMRYHRNRPDFEDVCFAIAYFMAGGGNIAAEYDSLGSCMNTLIKKPMIQKDTGLNDNNKNSKQKMVKIDSEFSTDENISVSNRLHMKMMKIHHDQSCPCHEFLM